MPRKPPDLLSADRLVLRKPVLEDASTIFDLYAQDKVITKFLTWQPHKSIKETRSFIKRCVLTWQKDEAFPGR